MRIRLLLALLAAPLGCAVSNAVWIQPNSDVGKVVFRIAQTPKGDVPLTTFYGLTVAECGGRVTWEFGTSGSNGPPPGRVIYGEVPPGFVTKAAPRPLRPGCYHVFITGAASTTFEVTSDGKVIERR